MSAGGRRTSRWRVVLPPRKTGTAAGPAGRSVEEGVPCCTVPAGESPVRVSAGAPGSRPAPEAERPGGEAWCRKPSAAQAVGGKQQRGPQHQVNPAASSELQSESRAEHVPRVNTPREPSRRGGTVCVDVEGSEDAQPQAHRARLHHRLAAQRRDPDLPALLQHRRRVPSGDGGDPPAPGLGHPAPLAGGSAAALKGPKATAEPASPRTRTRSRWRRRWCAASRAAAARRWWRRR
jgi:hypothetical protein